jgi:hypothetical protein
VNVSSEATDHEWFGAMMVAPARVAALQFRNAALAAFVEPGISRNQGQS